MASRGFGRICGGAGEVRTHARLSRLSVFKAAPFATWVLPHISLPTGSREKGRTACGMWNYHLQFARFSTSASTLPD